MTDNQKLTGMPVANGFTELKRYSVGGVLVRDNRKKFFTFFLLYYGITPEKKRSIVVERWVTNVLKSL